MKNQFDKVKISILITKLYKYIKSTTKWFDDKIGDLVSINDITTIDNNNELNLGEIYLRKIQFTVKVSEKYLKNPSVLLEKIGIKKLVIIDMIKDTHLDNHLINPAIVEVNEPESLISFEASLPINWKGKIQNHFENHWLAKSDIDKYFEVDTLKHIIEGLQMGSIISSDVLETIIGNKEYVQKPPEKIKSIYNEGLDEWKANAFNAAASNDDLTIIKGPPGTGKSYLISKLVQHFVNEKKEKVIIASRTHAALDNIVENISVTKHSKKYTGILLEKSSYKDENSDYTNISKMLSQNIRHQLLKNLSKNSHLRKELSKTFNPRVSANRFTGFSREDLIPDVFLGTITSAKLETNIKSKNYDFDNAILIMDEVSKSSIIDILRYSTYSKKIILVGDDMQLGPIINQSSSRLAFIDSLSTFEKKLYSHLFSENVFIKLYKENINNIILNETYRSPQYILDLYNFIAYKNKLKTRVKKVNQIKFKKSVKNYKLIKLYEFNKILVDDKSSFHEQNVNVSNRSKINLKELKNIMDHLKFLSQNMENQLKISIMVAFFYKDQYELFFRKFNNKLKYYEKKFKMFMHGTIDQLQGKEADVVLLGTTYTNPNGSTNIKYATLIQNIKRLNVALSRTKNKLILFCNYDNIKNKKLYIDGKWTNYKLSDILNKFDVKGTVTNENKDIAPLNLVL